MYTQISKRFTQNSQKNALQQLENSSERELTLIDLSGSSKSLGKTENVNFELDIAIPKNVPVSMALSQILNTSKGQENKPSPSKKTPEMFPTPPNPPGPSSIFVEAFVTSQHDHRLIEALPYFSDELIPLTLSEQQGRLMGIGLEQNSETAFAEFVQLTLNPENDPVPLEEKAYIRLWYS